MNIRAHIVVVVALLYIFPVAAQGPKIVDRVVAVVGNNIILQSDVDKEYTNWLAHGNKPDLSYKCVLLQQQLIQKLLSDQAVIDSIEVGESEVDDEINRRLRHLSAQAGGQERLENFLNQSLLQYKEAMRPSVHEQLKANRMQMSIVRGVDVTPMEVSRYFNSLDSDSLPYFNTEVEVGELVIHPKLNVEEKQRFRLRAEEIRKRVVDGEDFAGLARLYSQDRGSAPFGGDLGFMTRDNLVKEFSAIAFRLRPGEISPVFESEFGFHFLQVMERRGEEVRARHILIQTEPTIESLNRAKAHIDSIYENVLSGKLSFYAAATMYSDNRESKTTGGMVVNYQSQQSRSTLIPMDLLSADMFSAIDTLRPGEFSSPARFTDQAGKTGFRFTYLKTRIPPHQANLDQDFAKIKEAAMEDKINRRLSEWFEGRRKLTYIDVNEDFAHCDELKLWMKPLEKVALD